jgi:hypothetical protein
MMRRKKRVRKTDFAILSAPPGLGGRGTMEDVLHPD